MKRFGYLAGLLWILLPLAAQTSDAARETRRSNGIGIGPARPDFPLHIAAATFGDHMLKVLLVNVTTLEVKQVTVSVLLEDKDSPVPVTRLGKVCTASIPPDGFLLVTNANTAFDDVDAYFRGKNINQRTVRVAIANVRLAGGAEWSNPLQGEGRFGGAEEEDKKLGKKIVARLTKAFGGKEGALPLFLDPPPTGPYSTCRN